jgi:hypothetical protein
LKKFRMPRKRWQRTLLYLVSTSFILLGGDMLLTKVWRHVTIAPDTTYITTPLHPNGMPDYTSWLNERMARGVTPENNAAVPILLAAGTDGTLSDSRRDEVLTGVGLPARTLPRKYQYFSLWARRQFESASATAAVTTPPAARPPSDADLQKQEEQLCIRPWKTAEHPLWTQWLDSQKESLDLAHQAAARPRYHFPALPSSAGSQPGDSILALLPSLGVVRGLSNLLLSDAQHQIADGNAPAFTRDVTDAIKIGNLLTQRPFVIENLVGYAIQQSACKAALNALAEPGLLQASDAGALLAAMDAIPPLPEIDFNGERMMHLDLCCFVAEFGYSRSLYGFDALGFREARDPPFAALRALVVPLHINAKMREINGIFDEIGQSQRLPTYRERAGALRRLETEFQASVARVRRSTGLDRIFAEAGPLIADPNARRQAVITQRDLTRVALALHACRAAKGEYPVSLESLAAPGGTLAKVPLDGFTDAPLLYKKDGTGYLLYSVGTDETDNGGDEKTDQVVRMKQ